MRTAVALVLAASLVATLAGCTSTEAPVSGDCTASGSVSDAVKVSGKFGAEPTVEFEAPLKLEATQRSVAIEGDGEVVKADDVAVVDYAVYNATTGIRLEASGYTGDGRIEVTVSEAATLPGLVKTVECSTVGSRVVGVVTAKDAFGEAGASDIGIGANENILFVVDVVSIVPPVKSEDYATSEGLPIVTFDDAGVPTVEIPDTEAPSELRVAVITEGDGAVVGPTDDVLVHYQGTNWQTGEIFDSSWDRGQPSPFNLQQVVPGFTKAIAGQKIGSTIIAVIPPELGYGPGGGRPEAGIGPDDVLVFVLTILDPATGE